MLFVRSLVFNVLFYAVFVCLAILALPTLLMPVRALMTIARWWAKATLVLMRVICNIKVEFRGAEKIPEGPLVVVAKHQSFWETIALPPLFEHPIFILKRQLMYIPVFGQFLAKYQMIAIDRTAGVKTLLEMTRRARARVHGRLGDGPLEVRLRYRGRPLRGRVVDGGSGVRIALDDPADGVAPGQTAALYRDGRLVAAGTIAHSPTTDDALGRTGGLV